jgi:diaminohydroxyphosphoribosylaminopyrimidine deaminase/5-amino-6-(5-phosphoribosylamino)uracil reductase
MAERSPVRIVLDAQLRLPTESRLAQGARDVPVWVIARAEAPAERARALERCGVQILRVDRMNGDRLDLGQSLQLIAARGITRLMVEGGPTVAASFVAADLVDEAAVLRSQTLIGAEGIAPLAGMGFSALTRSPRLVSRGVEPIGPDEMETFERPLVQG